MNTARTKSAYGWRGVAWPGRIFDLGVVVGLLGIGVVTLASSTHEFPRLGPGRIPTYLVVAAALGSLLLRRHYPLATLGVVLAALLAEALLRSPIFVQPLVLVGVYTVAARLPRRMSLAITAASVVLFVTATSIPNGGLSFQELLTALVAIGAAYVIGMYAGTRAAYVDSLQARARDLDRERLLLAQKAVADERVRIARELHDVVAHHVALLTVQAGALQAHLSPEHPAHALAATMAEGGREAMNEMRRMLGVLRSASGDAPALTPQPGIEQIPTLVEQSRAAGLDVELAMDRGTAAVPEAIDLSAYRIVQEALTNVLRHAGPAHCRVDVRVAVGAVQLSIVDNGRGPGGDGGAGQGLVGMRERVALFGGSLAAGAAAGGGFAVESRLPFDTDGRAS